ncbi:BTAD domain-containing putative transcriptional regulator [Spongisporangium articulatum]|uniref:BTAD domain-containing putative transcriptional regulator n=1 Tax=Spongisporangium articulatum TaxID=3362603 RepID=A0ABW8AH42_9ACTN
MGGGPDGVPRVRVSLLGPTVVTLGDEPISLGGPRQRAVLTLLALQVGHPVQPGQLIDTLWRAAPPATAANTVQVYVSRLKRALTPGEAPSPLRSAEGAYRLDLPEDAVDVLCFEALAARGHAQLASGEVRAAAETLRAGLALWRGEPLPDLVGLADARIAGLLSLRQAARADRVDAELALGRFTTLVPELEQLVGEFPFDERFVVQLMSALYGAGRQADALTAFVAAQARLRDELGVDPGPALRAHYERVLRQELPPPAGTQVALAVRPGGAAPPADRFVGRGAELAHVVALLRRDDVRLVSVLGAGGAGKTRLIRELVDRITRDGSATTVAGPVPLVTLTRVEDVVPEVCRVMGTEPDWVGEPALDAAARALAGCDLLVLDNLEQIDRVAVAVSHLLERVPTLTVLVTSRQAMGLRGERIVHLGPLPVPSEGTSDPSVALESDAVRLFRDRAQLVLPEFDVRPENATAVSELCRRLDGLPLALELAAARVRMLPPADILARLDQVLALLDTGSPGMAERHGSMRATIEWSVRMLDPMELRVFEELSVFAGGWTLAAAETICAREASDPPGADASVLDALHRLLERSLLVADGSGRMTMLETVRQYAATLLAVTPERLRRTRERHARFYTELAEELGPTVFGLRFRDPTPNRLLTADAANLAAALAFSREQGHQELLGRLVAALVDHWYTTGRVGEADQWVQAAQEAQLPAATQGRLLIALGNLRIAAGDARAAYELYAGAGQVVEGADDDYLRFRALRCRAQAARFSGDREAGLALMFAAHDELHGLDRPDVERANRNECGELLDLVGRTDEALQFWRAVLPEAVAAGDVESHMYALINCARVALERGDVDQAAVQLDEALDVARTVEGDPILIDALATVAAGDLVAGRPAAAVGHLSEAIRLAVGCGLLLVLPECLDLLAATRLALGDPVTAARLRGAVATWRADRSIAVEHRLLERLVADVEARLAAAGAAGAAQQRLVIERARGARTPFGSVRGLRALDPALAEALDGATRP